MAAVALVLSYLETMIPLPVALPGVKLGLANVAVAVTLFACDAQSAAAVAVVKVLASGFLFGSPMMLAYSLGGTALSFAGMLALSAVPGVGLVPVSMVAAVLHNAGQLAVAALVLGTPSVFVNLPVLAVAACVTGGVTGYVADAALESVEGEVGGAAGEDEDIAAAGGRPVIDTSGLVLRAGERVAFVGANGSGKTSCALQLAGLGEGGEAAVVGARGNDSDNEPQVAGLAFQDPDSQIVAPVVRDDVAFGLESAGMPREEMLTGVSAALERLGIAELSARQVATLSGGQKQRVAIAGLVAMGPDLVVFDEVTSMLDPAAREEFSAIVRSLTSRGVAVVQVTQLMDEAFEADRIVVFRDCAIVAQGTPAELLCRAELLEECGLELPACARLACELRAAGLDVPLTNDMDELGEAAWRLSA